jgi:putative hydrolase of the HAD superfamily
MNCRAVLFDLYDTLALAEAGGSGEADAGFTQLLAGAGVARDAWERHWQAGIRACMRGGVTLMQQIRSVLRAADADGADPTLADEIAALIYSRWVPRLYADTRPALTELRNRGYRLALVSNVAWYTSWLAELELDQHFDHLVLSCEVKLLKPEPEMYLHAAARLSVPPRECIFVGDGMDRELSGARVVGMTTVRVDRAVRGNNAPRDDCFDYRVTDLKGLLDWLPRRVGAAE